MSQVSESNDGNAKKEAISLKDFLESIPPGKEMVIADQPITNRSQHGHVNQFLKSPDIELYCLNCQGERFFECERGDELYLSVLDHFIRYACKNCEQGWKKFAVAMHKNQDGDIVAYKYGEAPEFGPPTSSRLTKLVGAERDYFFKGRRSENQGLGIAAFAYYRRVIENQRNKIFDEIIRVTEALGTDKEFIDELKAAKAETQFMKAIESIKHGMPQTLMVQGHNPLTLLHGALSEGLHAQTDDECLGMATSIRVVLAELAEKLSHALSQKAELKDAVSSLLNAASKRAQKSKE